MAKKYVYQKNASGVSDFVYVDLLPQVKRARQFNMNVIIAGTLAVVATYMFIFVPYRQQTELFEEKNGMLNDLTHRLTLKLEEEFLHEIDMDIIEFEEQKDDIIGLRVDFTTLIEDIEITVFPLEGDIKEISYSAETETFTVKIATKYEWLDSTYQEDILQLKWVEDLIPVSKNYNGDLWELTYTLEVNPQNVE